MKKNRNCETCKKASGKRRVCLECKQAVPRMATPGRSDGGFAGWPFNRKKILNPEVH